MASGMLYLPAEIVARWFIAGKTKEDTQGLLNLPESFQVEALSMEGSTVGIKITSPEIPEVAEGEQLPLIQATYPEDAEGHWGKPESIFICSRVLKSSGVLQEETSVGGA